MILSWLGLARYAAKAHTRLEGGGICAPRQVLTANKARHCEARSSTCSATRRSGPAPEPRGPGPGEHRRQKPGGRPGPAQDDCDRSEAHGPLGPAPRPQACAAGSPQLANHRALHENGPVRTEEIQNRTRSGTFYFFDSTKFNDALLHLCLLLYFRRHRKGTKARFDVSSELFGNKAKWFWVCGIDGSYPASYEFPEFPAPRKTWQRRERLQQKRKSRCRGVCAGGCSVPLHRALALARSLALSRDLALACFLLPPSLSSSSAYSRCAGASNVPPSLPRRWQRILS